MDDKTTANDRGAGSKTPDTDNKVAPASAPVAPAQEPEPVILEETITRPAPAKPVPPPAPPANPVAQISEDRSVPVTPQPIAPVAPPPAPPPMNAESLAPLTGDFIPPEMRNAAEPVPAPPPVPPSAIVRKIPLAVPTLPAPSNGTAVSPAPEPVAEEKNLANIEHVLETIKLPERRDSPNTVNPENAKQARTYDTSLGAILSEGEKTAPEGGALATPEETPPTPPANTADAVAAAPTAQLHTLKSDLQEIVRVKKVSLVRAVALEQDKRRGSRNAEASLGPQRSRRLFGTLFAVALLIGLGAAAIFGVTTIMKERAGAAPAALQGSSLLFAETTVPLSLTDLSVLDLKRLLAQVRMSGSATLGSITNIVPVVSVRNEDGTEARAPASLGEFLTALGAHVPPDLLRALKGDFFLGLHTVDENAPLLVIPVTSYERAFAGMLAWEGAMNADLSPFFTAVPDQIAGPGGLPQKRRFEDLVMRNYDVRVLKNDAGGIELYYSFPTQNILIIGESPYSFTEILSRLRAERKL